MSKFRTLVMYFALLMVTLMLLFGVSRIENRLDSAVAEHNLRFTGQIKNAPPLVVFTTVALGSFRGLVADLLWLRAGALQESGNYFEMVQLARWITDLQPTFSGATAYLAWNMAYNISVTSSSWEDRWRWVNEGIKLIRDQAIEYNPEDPVLYKEVAWIFQHKLGNIMDDANLYYKNRLAIQMANIAGLRPDWKAFAAAPENEKEFRKVYLPDHRFWKALKAAGFEDYAAFYNAFRSSEPAVLPPAFLAKIADDAELVKALQNYFHAQLLRDRLKLDPRRIVKLMEKYGDMDWRVPESQAIYWASLGIERTPGHKDISCDRVIAQSLYESFRSGRILMVDDTAFESITVAPNLALVDAVYDNFINVQQNYEPDNPYSTFRSARINFMKEAVTILYNYGNFSKAAEYYEKLKKEEPGKPDYRKDLESFVMAEWAEDVRDATVKKASEIISGLVSRSIFYLIYGDDEAAVSFERMARYIYRQYQSDMGQEDRTKLPPYKDMKKAVVEALSRTLNPVMLEILKKKIQLEKDEAEQAAPAAGAAAK